MTLEFTLSLTRESFSLEVELEIAARGVTALFGPSGSGKTTILRAIAGLDRHPGARVRWEGTAWQDSRSWVPPHQRRVGFVTQEAALFSHLDVEANLRFGFDRASPEHRPEFARVVSVLGLERLLTRSTTTLSGGERQRVALGRALLGGPHLLLLDEPLAALDQPGRREILEHLAALRDSLAVPMVYVSHDTGAVAGLADHVVLLERGCVRGAGPAGELLTRLDLQAARAEDAAAVLHVSVAAHDADYSLTTVAFEGGKLVVPMLPAEIGSGARVRIAARDVAVSLEPPQRSSVRNVVHARIDGLESVGPAHCLLRLGVGGQFLLARVTRKSVDELELTAGSEVFAQIKSVALVA